MARFAAMTPLFELNRAPNRASGSAFSVDADVFFASGVAKRVSFGPKGSKHGTFRVGVGAKKTGVRVDFSLGANTPETVSETLSPRLAKGDVGAQKTGRR